ncbi:YibE/F family protein [Nocardioides sambongensis]|uniref:YibE/F family protein n=1 Tax=Nocardioides sambongensis TaxID=2589074 RepID=UPI001127BEEC|nr:YibE/F family protein [Nocardioides sambongensis]
MGKGHAHRADRDVDEQVQVARGPANVLLAGLAVCLLAALAGLVAWWPTGEATALGDDQDASRYAAEGVSFPVGEITEIVTDCSDTAAQDGTTPARGCPYLRVDLGDDGEVAVAVAAEVVDSGLEPGDRVELQRTPTEDGVAYSYSGIDRDSTLLLFFLLFVGVVLLIARWRGLFALVGMAFGGAVVWWFVLPALLEGAPGVGVALAGSTAIMFVVLYTTHGFSLRTSTALAGTLVGVALTAGLGQLALQRANLVGISEESGAFLAALAPGLDFQSLLGCALVIAGLGVLNDVTITQASAVWELRAVAPGTSRRGLFAAGMRIGRDHIASTIYTIVFAYVGTALLVLMLYQVYARPLHDLLSTEQLAEEIVRTLVTSIGLVLAVPITTALAALVVGGRGGEEITDSAGSTPAAASPRRRHD